MQVTKCDKCKKIIKREDGYMRVYAFKLVPQDSFYEVELCKSCSDSYLKKLSRDKLVNLKKETKK